MPSSASQAQLRRSCPALQASPSSQECSSAAIAPTSRPRFPCTYSCSAPTSVRNLAAATCWDAEQCLICHCWSTPHALTVPLGLLQVGHRLCARLTHIVASPDDHVGQAQALAGALQSQASAQVLSAQPANPSSPAARVQLLHWDMLHKGMPGPQTQLTAAQRPYLHNLAHTHARPGRQAWRSEPGGSSYTVCVRAGAGLLVTGLPGGLMFQAQFPRFRSGSHQRSRVEDGSSSSGLPRLAAMLQVLGSILRQCRTVM